MKDSNETGMKDSNDKNVSMDKKDSKNRFIIRSKNVYTGLTDAPTPAAVAIEGNRIVAVLPWTYTDDPNGTRADGSDGAYADVPQGDNAENPYRGWPLTDYGEKMIMPSFVDAHTHLFRGAVDASSYVCDDLGECHSQQECALRMQQFAAEHPDYGILRGSGWFPAGWDEMVYPDCRSLDRLIPDRPVFLMNADCHSMWLNTRGMQMAGIDAHYRPAKGEVVHFEDGTPTGLLVEPEAYAPAEEIFSSFTQSEQKEIHEAFQKTVAANGIGALSEMFAHDYTDSTQKSYDVLRELDTEGKLNTQIYVYTKLFGYTDFTLFHEFQKRYDTPHFHIAGLKGFVDGVTETHTGLLLEPYADDPTTCGNGLPLWPKEAMQEEITAANKAGIPVRLHCIADGSVRMALDLYEKAQKESGRYDLGNTIEHIENIHPSDLPRFAALQVIASMQPYHLILSNNSKLASLGRERCRYEFPWHSVLEAGAHLALGTDYPVVSLNPFATMQAALTRREESGAPSGQNADLECMTLPEVLRGYTIEGARVYHAEKEMGTLEAGKMANIIVLSGNLFETPPEKIGQMKVQVNYFEGRKCYEE